MELQQTTFDLHDLIHGVGAVLKARANEKGLTGGVDIALIADGLKVDAGAYLAAGMDAYVSKPIRGRELYAALAPFLGAAKEEPVLRLVKG